MNAVTARTIEAVAAAIEIFLMRPVLSFGTKRSRSPPITGERSVQEMIPRVGTGLAPQHGEVNECNDAGADGHRVGFDAAGLRAADDGRDAGGETGGAVDAALDDHVPVEPEKDAGERFRDKA